MAGMTNDGGCFVNYRHRALRRTEDFRRGPVAIGI
jgi:hypothetical protein